MKRKQVDIKDFFKKKQTLLQQVNRDSADKTDDSSDSNCESESEPGCSIVGQNVQGHTSTHGPPDALREGPSHADSEQNIQGQTSSDGPPDESADPPREETTTDSDEDSDDSSSSNLPIPPLPTYAAPKGPQDISQTRAAGPAQPILKTFPRTQLGKGRTRAFNASWYKDFTWLEYSQSKDTAHCFVCRHFSLPSSPETTFSSGTGFSNWKKATYKDGGFHLHTKAEHHVKAMVAWTEYKRCVENNTSLLQVLDKEHQKRVEENRNYIKTIADVLLCTATQNIAQRGHRESGKGNKGNFLAIMELIAKHNPLVKQKMQHRNAKYTSNSIQNEILSVLAEMVRRDIVKEVKQSGAFSILADETKDLQKKEQISLVLRYYYDGTVQESFLQFEHADKLDAAGLTEKILNTLQSYGLEYREQLVGQGYDGASVMSGKHSGVSARIQALAKHAFYVHCNAHCLNLVIVDTVKALPDASCFFSLLQRLYTFLSGSYVHQKWLDIQRTMYPQDQPRELPKLSDVRWACRFYACRNLMDRLPAVLSVLHEIDEENNGDRCVEARGLHGQIDLNFIGLLATFRRILGDSNSLSAMLQSKKIDLALAVDLIEALQDTFVQYRDEQCFGELWAEVVDIAQQCKISTEKVSKRQPKTSSALHGSVVTSTIVQRISDRCKDYFRTAVFYPILDTVNAELQKRFSKKNCDIMKGIQALNPKSSNFLEETPLFLFGTIYNTNLDDLSHELHQAKRILERKKAAGMQTLNSLLEFTVFLEPYSEVFFELFRLCKIAVALPVSTASCERSFSALKLIKNHMRTTMNDDRLSDLGVLSVESQRAKALDMDEFLRVFCDSHGNRKILLF